MYDVLKGLKKGGSFLLNSLWDEKEVGEHLPNAMKRYLAENEINFYIINGTKIGQQLGLGNRTNTIMQSAFFKITNVIPYDLAVSEMKKAIDKSYGKKGEAIVKMNYAAVDAGGLAENVVKVTVPAEWKNLKDETCAHDENRPEFIRNVVDVMNAQKGDDLPVSAFAGREDGTFPAGTSKFEKRGIAISVPEWQTYTRECLEDFYALNTYIYSNFYADNLSPEVHSFYSDYKNWYSKNLINTFPKYGILGFDTGMYFLGAINKYGSNFENNLDKIHYKSIQTGFDFHRVNNWGGFINTNLFIVHYKNDYTVTRSEVR